MIKEVEIYTDGACSGNPGKGGYAGILIYKGVEKIVSGGEEMTQKDVADLLGISQSYISRLEKKIILRLKKEIAKME